jgi:hypothetical protein
MVGEAASADALLLDTSLIVAATVEARTMLGAKGRARNAITSQAGRTAIASCTALDRRL